MTAIPFGKILRLLVCLLAITGAGTRVFAARPYADGDVFVGFRATSGQGMETDYLVNVGAATQFTNAAGAFSVNLGDTVLADLTALYGSNWHSRADIRWSVSGAQLGAGAFPSNTIFASRAEDTPGIKSPSWNRATNATQLAPATKIGAMAAAYAQGNATAGQVESGTLGLRQPVGAADSYDSNMPGGERLSSFEFYQSALLGIENTFANGAVNSVLDFYKMEPRPVGSTLPGVLVGAFRMNSSAQLTFSPVVSAFAAPVVSFSVSAVSVNEDVASGKVTLTVNRTGVTNSALTVRFSTVNGTAIAGTDFVAQTDTAIAFAVNEVSKTVDVAIVDVPGFSGDRMFKGVLTVAAAEGFAAVPREVDVTIVETDTQPSTVAFSAATYSVAEDGGSIELTIERTGFTGVAATVSLSTVDGSAVAGTDFTGQTNTLVTFGVGQPQKTVNIAVANRAGFVGNRQFSVALSNATNGASVRAPGNATVTILELDPQPAVFAFSADSYSISEDGGSVQITVNRRGSGVPVSVDFRTTDFTALGGTDFVALQNVRLEFAQDELSKVVDVEVINRSGFSLSRQFGVELFGPTGVGQIGTPDRAIVTINDAAPNPAGRFVFGSTIYKFSTRTRAGAPNTVSVTIVREVGQVGTASVDVSLILGGFPVGSVVPAGPATVTFVQGERTKEFVLLLSESVAPGTFSLSLQNATGGSSVGVQGTTSITLALADTKLPVVKLTSPKAGKVGATFDVAGSVTEADALDRVEISLNGEKQIATLSGKSFSLAGLEAENGPNTVTVVAFDEKGTASKPVSVVVTFLDPSVAGKAGSYSGLVVPTGVAPPAGRVHNASGFVSLKVTPTGAFTGKVLVGGFSLPVKGVIASSGDARFSGSAVLQGKAVVLGKLALNIAGGRLVGTLGTAATVDGDRAFYDGKTNVVSPELLLANKGKFTAVVPARLQNGLSEEQFPQGDGIAFGTLNTKGIAKFSGVLADGTKFTASAPLSQQNKAPVYALLYGKKGSFAGAVTFDTTVAESDFRGSDFLWLRPAQTVGTHYLAGWPGGLNVDLLGAKYVIPAKAEDRSVFPFPGGSGSATMTFADGNLADLVERDVAISSTNAVTNSPAASDRSYRLAIKATTGGLSGDFPHTDGSKTKFTGVIFQKGVLQGGYGFFLSNVPKGAVAGKGGGVTILP